MFIHCNTKLINLGEKSESSSPFLYCLSYPSIFFGGFATPAARQTSAVFFIEFSPQTFCTSIWNLQSGPCAWAFEREYGRPRAGIWRLASGHMEADGRGYGRSRGVVSGRDGAPAVVFFRCGFAPAAGGVFRKLKNFRAVGLDLLEICCRMWADSLHLLP